MRTLLCEAAARIMLGQAVTPQSVRARPLSLSA
jgi:hypothetical protein